MPDSPDSGEQMGKLMRALGYSVATVQQTAGGMSDATPFSFAQELERANQVYILEMTKLHKGGYNRDGLDHLRGR